MRWRGACTLVLVVISGIAAAQTVSDRASTAAAAVQETFGSGEALTENGVKPLTTDDPMRTVDGTPFEAQVGCEASARYLRVTMQPGPDSDIERFSVEMDADFDGQYETGLNFTGPFGGLCNNGVIQCDAGTWDHCRYLRWSTGSSLALEEVTPRDLGACYCINASCGANLLLVNSRKVITDLGNSVLSSAQRLAPRITAARNLSDDVSITFFGQESACGTDRAPEQHYRRPQDLTAAGLTVRDDPGSLANFLRSTAVAQGRGSSMLSCELNREIATAYRSKHDILRLLSSTRGTSVNCGAGCLRFRIGDERQNLYRGGGGSRCHVATESQQYFVGYPALIQSLRLVSGRYDDGLRLRANEAVIYTSRPGWTGAGVPATRCNWGNEVVTPNLDIRGGFATPGTLTLAMDVAHDEAGEGWMWMEARLLEGCTLERENIIDGCTAAAANPRCRLRNEWVDDVQTVSSFRTTGLGPLPSARSVGVSCTLDAGTRPWWRTRREYECRQEGNAFDGEAAVDRYQSIHSTIDVSSGAFTDRRQMANGEFALEEARVALPAETSTGACTPMCRTRKLRPGANVADSGPTTRLNATGVAYDFTFKECDQNVCPLEAGEEVAGACDCRSNFAHAASLMQTIRLVAEDAACAAQ